MILVFGSLNMDLILPVPALPTPGETVLSGQDYLTRPGGKGGNQAVAAARAGADVAMAACVGDDAFGQAMRGALAAEGIATDLVTTCDRASGLAVICVDPQAENFIAVAGGANLALSADAVADARLSPATLVLLQGEVPAEENWRVIDRAARAGARTVLNMAPAAPVPAVVLDALDILVVNRPEARAIAAELGLAADRPEALAVDLARRFALTVIVTLGREGALAAEPAANGLPRLWYAPPVPIAPVDSTGAGDAFTGALVAALDSGHTVADALHRGGVGGALACLALGARESLPDADAIAARLATSSPPRRLA